MVDQFIKPYVTEYHEGQKQFSINPEYTALFQSLGIEEGSAFFKADPFLYGVHGESGEDEPHFQFFEKPAIPFDYSYSSFQSLLNKKLFVKKDDLPLLHGRKVDKEQVESFFESLKISVEYILYCLEGDNDWAKTNYKEVYLEDLSDLIIKYRQTLNIT